MLALIVSATSTSTFHTLTEYISSFRLRPTLIKPPVILPSGCPLDGHMLLATRHKNGWPELQLEVFLVTMAYSRNKQLRRICIIMQGIVIHKVSP